MAINDTTKNALNDLRIASPCPMQWAKMELTEEQAVRFCGDCKKKVYNIADMNAEEASMVLQRAQAAGGSACVRLYRRADGTVITDDCPIGLRRVRDMWQRLKSTAAALAIVLTALPAFGESKDTDVAVSKDAAAASKKNPFIVGGVKSNGPAAIPLAGAPCVPNWREIALKVPSVKRINDRLDEASKNPSPSYNDRIKLLRLKLELAQESERVKVPYYALDVLALAEIAAEALPDQPGRADRLAKVELIRDILEARKANCNTLTITDTHEIDQKLKKLESQR